MSISPSCFQIPVGQRRVRGVLEDVRRAYHRHEGRDGEHLRHAHRPGAHDPHAGHQQPVRQEPRHLQPHGRVGPVR